MIIYKVTNKITQEIYIGQTSVSLNNRKADHIYKAFRKNYKDKFHSALREFGLRNFNFEQIHRTSNKTNLYKKEKQYIIQYDTINYGYNTQIRKDK